jgi:hypothetical protein
MPAHLKSPKIPGETKLQRKARLLRARRDANPELRARNNASAIRSHRKFRLENPDIAKQQAADRWQREKDKPGHKMMRKGEALRRLYGITLEEFNKMAAEQDGRCAVCGMVPWRLVVDHCHRSEEVRQLLCDTCNMAIGLFQDNPHLMQTAASYVEKHNQRIQQ